MAKGATPGREQIIRRMWKLANAGVEDAVKLACFPTEEWGGLEGMNLDALTEFKRGSNGVVELKFTDRARLLERLLDAADHSGEDQVDRFLSAMEHQEEGKGDRNGVFAQAAQGADLVAARLAGPGQAGHHL